MTQNTESRLDRIEALLGTLTETTVSNSQQIQANSQQIEANTKAIAQLGQRFDSLISEVQRVLNQSGEQINRLEANAEFVHDAITRLTQTAVADRTEFRRIWEYLESQQRHQGNGHG